MGSGWTALLALTIFSFIIVAKACNLGKESYSGCSSAPACDSTKVCVDPYTTSCTRYHKTFCQGCFKGVPGCHSGWSIDGSYGNNFALANGVQGGGCTVACCTRGCKMTLTRSCPKIGCCKQYTCPNGYEKKADFSSVQGDASAESCCNIKTRQCDTFQCPVGYRKKSSAGSVLGAASTAACCDACLVTQVTGHWIYKFDGNQGDSYTLEEGVSSSSSNSFARTDEWSQSLSGTISAGYDFCIGASGRRLQGSGSVSSCASIGISVTKETGSSQAREHATSFTRERSSSQGKQVAINHDGVALWQFEYDVMGECSQRASVSTSQFAFSPARHIPPRCLPGYCDAGNHPKSMCCSCKTSPAGQTVEIPGATACPKPECAKELRTTVILGSSVQVGPSEDMSAGTQMLIPCGSLNPDFLGNVILKCSSAVELVPDASGCSRKGEPTGSPTPSPGGQTNDNQCICGAGVAAQGALCPKMGAVSCVSCHPGYVLQQSDCVKDNLQAGDPSGNQCTCSWGVPAQGALCHRSGAVSCVSCNVGYVLEQKDCVKDKHQSGDSNENQCICAWGVAARGSLCPRTGATRCVSCHEGYELISTLCFEDKKFGGVANEAFRHSHGTVAMILVLCVSLSDKVMAYL